MKQRLLYLDNLRAILIMLVVLGHCVQWDGCYPDYNSNLLFRFIYSFHMPLFFAISGYLTYKGRYDEKLMGKRALQLLVPFVVWAFISPLFRLGTFSWELTSKALCYPDYGLWFLYNLFFYCVIFNLSELVVQKFRCKQELVVLSFVALLYALMAMVHTLFNVTQLCWFVPFFAIGYYGRKYGHYIKRRELLIYVIGGVRDNIPFLDEARRPSFLSMDKLGWNSCLSL